MQNVYRNPRENKVMSLRFPINLHPNLSKEKENKTIFTFYL